MAYAIVTQLVTHSCPALEVIICLQSVVSIWVNSAGLGMLLFASDRYARGWAPAAI
jgi:hypothetical protein